MNIIVEDRIRVSGMKIYALRMHGSIRTKWAPQSGIVHVGYYGALRELQYQG